MIAAPKKQIKAAGNEGTGKPAGKMLRASMAAAASSGKVRKRSEGGAEEPARLGQWQYQCKH
eukprot:186185-Alexandrium_andersonii.AAC.1